MKRQVTVLKKKGIPIFFIMLLITGGNMRAEEGVNLKGIHIGMTSAEFSRIGEHAAVDGQVSKPQELYGLPGAWTWDFKAGKLDWYLWDAYIDDLSEKNFMAGLAAARRIIEDCTRQLGKPAGTETGDMHFRDPYKDHHWGYPVLSADWLTPDLKLHAGFRFIGSKGEYHFIVSIEVHGPDYEF